MPSAMWAAGSASPATSACSAAVARSGVAPMFVSAIRASSTPPLSRRTIAATPTVAQSCARRVNLRYDQPVTAELGDPDLGQQLPRPDGRVEDAAEELGRGHRPLAFRPGDHELGFQREHHRRQVGGRVAVGERAADRAAVAHLRVADQPGRVRDDRAVLLHERILRRSPCNASARRSPATRPRRGRTRAPRGGRRRRAAPAVRFGASSPESANGRRRGASRPRASRAARARARATRRPRSRTWRGSSCLLERAPDPFRGGGHGDLVDAEGRERVHDGVHHRRRRGDRARLPHPLHAERVVRGSASRCGRSRTSAAPQPTAPCT